MSFWMNRLSKSHPVSDEELSTHADGRLAPERAAEVEVHVAGCESCRTARAELRSLKSMLAALPAAETPRSFALSADQGRQRAGHGATRPAGRLALMPAMALTALLLLFAVDFAVVGGGNETPGLARSTAQKVAQSESGGFSAPTAAAAARDSAAPAPPAPAGTPGPAAAASGADRPAAANSTAEAAGAQAPQPGQPAAGEGETQALTATDSGDGARGIIRALEVVAALALVGSIGYVFFRSRQAAG